MRDMSSFCDEFLKIAVSREAAQHQKGRTGKRPIRVHNLVKQSAPIEPLTSAVGNVLKHPSFLKPVALVGGSGLGAMYLKRKLDEMRVGHEMLKQQGR